VGSVSDCVAQTPGNPEIGRAEPGLPFVPAGSDASAVTLRDEFSDESAPRAAEKPAVSVPRCFEMLADPIQARIDNPRAQIAEQSAATADLRADKLGAGSTQA